MGSHIVCDHGQLIDGPCEECEREVSVRRALYRLPQASRQECAHSLTQMLFDHELPEINRQDALRLIDWLSEKR